MILIFLVWLTSLSMIISKSIHVALKSIISFLWLSSILCVCVPSCFSWVWLLVTPMDCSPPGSSIHGILQTGILEWVPMPSSRRSSWPKYQTYVSYVSWIGRRVLYQQHRLEASISTHLDMYVVSVSWRLWTLRCMHLFKVECTPDACPGVGLLGHMVALFCFCFFLETCILFSIAATPIYIPRIDHMLSHKASHGIKKNWNHIKHLPWSEDCEFLS